MPLTVFSSGMNKFCRDYLVANPAFTPDGNQFARALFSEQTQIFEQLMLFDKINLKVFGENILVPVLINTFGLEGFEALIEQDAVSFTLWTPLVTFMTTEIPGLIPLQSGNLSTPAHCNPEQSIELGYQWMPKQLPRRVRRGLTKKLMKIYEMPPPELAAAAVSRALSAHKSGKLGKIGFKPQMPVEELGVTDRRLLCEYATQTLEYTYMLQRDMTSFSNYSYFGLLRDTATKVDLGTALTGNFSKLAILEGFPDFKALLAQIENPFGKLPELRARARAVKFRKWLASMSCPGNTTPISKAYIDAVADAQGFFETKKGRFVKSVALTSIGMAVGGAAGGVAGAMGGAAIAKFLEPAADFSLDLIDEFALNGLTKGWTPKMFFDDLAALRSKGP